MDVKRTLPLWNTRSCLLGKVRTPLVPLRLSLCQLSVSPLQWNICNKCQFPNCSTTKQLLGQIQLYSKLRYCIYAGIWTNSSLKKSAKICVLGCWALPYLHSEHRYRLPRHLRHLYQYQRPPRGPSQQHGRPAAVSHHVRHVSRRRRSRIVSTGNGRKRSTGNASWSWRVRGGPRVL